MEQEDNFVIDHSITEEEEFKKILQNFNKKIISKRISKNDKLLESKMIPPSKISSIWPWLTYQELQSPTVTIPEDPIFPQNTNNTNTESPSWQSPQNVQQSPRKINSASSSPLKLNKAVSCFRTPKKSNLTENIWNTIDCGRVVNNLLNIDNELFDSDADESNDGAEDKVIKICRVWFNANKMFKVREVQTQTMEYYDDVQIASNNVYSNTYPPPPTPPPLPPVSNDDNNCDFLDGLNLLDQASILKQITSEDNNIPWSILTDDDDDDNSSDSADLLSYVTKNMEKKGNFGTDEVFNKIMMMYRTDNNVPQIDGTWDDDDPMVKIGQLDGSTDDEQIVVVDDDEDELLPAPPSSNIKQEPVIPAAVSRTTAAAAVPVPSCDSLSSSCSSRGPTPGPARTPITPMMDLECDIPGNIVTTATLCSSCGNTFPNKKSYDGHLDQCPASRLSETAGTGTPDSDMSPRKDFSILGLLKQEDMKTEAPEERSEEDIVIISETISKAPPPQASA